MKTCIGVAIALIAFAACGGRTTSSSDDSKNGGSPNDDSQADGGGATNGSDAGTTSTDPTSSDDAATFPTYDAGTPTPPPKFPACTDLSQRMLTSIDDVKAALSSPPFPGAWQPCNYGVV